MDANAILTGVLIVVFCGVGVALIVVLLEALKFLKSTRATVENMTKQLEPTLANIETMTTNIQPAITKVDPLVDRVQLTLDSVNLEMMRVDQILEDVSEITETASSATAAVDNITSAPLKMVNSVADHVKGRFGGKNASEESAQLAEQRLAVAQALADYKEAEAKEAEKAAQPAPAEKAEPAAGNESLYDLAPEPFEQTEAAASAPESAGVEQAVEQVMAGLAAAEQADAAEQTPAFTSEPVIDPQVIAESPFFNENLDDEK